MSDMRPRGAESISSLGIHSSARMPPPVALLATFGSAVLYGLCFPPTRWTALGWVAQVPFLVCVRRSSPAVALLLGWLFTLTVAYTTGDWLPRAVATYYQQPVAVGVMFFFVVATLMAAPYVMLFAVLYRRLARLPGEIVPLVAAAAWIAQELARATVLTGNPWATFGYSQVGVLPLVQIADVTGVYGISFVLVAMNAAVAELWLAERQGARRRIRGLAAAGACTVLVLGYGFVRLRTEAAARASERPIKIAVIQGNLDLGSQWRAEFYGKNLEEYLRLTDEALASAKPRLVFWPESAMTFFLEDEPVYRAVITSRLRASGAQLVAGGPRETGDARPRYYNSTFLLEPDGQVSAIYDKLQLLPFAEYFPFARIDLLRRTFERVREFTPGPASRLLPTAAGPAGVMICNEAMFATPAAERVAGGAEFLVNPANDTWLGDPKYSEQAFDIVSLRAVEQRRYLVRTSTGGPSGVIDPSGRTQGRTLPFTQTWFAATIAARAAMTVYQRAGDLFAVLCAIATAIAAIVTTRRLRR